MIISIWKPKSQRLNSKVEILYYEKINPEFFKKNLKKGYVIVYKCDYCSSESHTNSSCLMSGSWNNMTKQMCRGCRSRKSEYEIKKTQIIWSKIYNSFKEKNYELITTEDEYNKAKNKSQFQLVSTCKSNHSYKCSWNNWEKGKICRKCYDEKRYKESVKFKYGYDLYYFLVWKYTKSNYKKYKSIINPNELKRGIKEHQLDHKYSISEGFKNGVLPSIISSVSNLQMIPYHENSSKGRKCSIDLDFLIEKYQSDI
jgi:hypothetical protein